MADDITLVNLDEGTDDPRQARVQLAETVRRLNAAWTVIFGNGSTDQSAELVAANSAGKPVLIIGAMHVGTATTLTVPIVDSMNRLFTMSSLITIDNGRFVRPEWWGDVDGAVHAAAMSLHSVHGGIVLLSNKTYKHNSHVYSATLGGGKYMSRDNVSFIGAKMPLIADDCASLVGGTIIQGPFIAYANNVEFRDIGFDCGKTVTDSILGGAADQGLVLTYPDEETKAASALKRGAKLHNIVGLCNSPTDPVHAVIMGEGYTDVNSTGELIGCYGVHGVVIKASVVRAESISAYLNSIDGLIIKSDLQATAVSSQVHIDKVFVRGGGPIGLTPHTGNAAGYSLYLHAAGNSIDQVVIGDANLGGHPVGIRNDFGDDSYAIAGVKFGRVVIDQIELSGARLGVQIAGSGEISRWHFDSIEARNTTIGAQFAFEQSSSGGCRVSIDQIDVVFADVALDMAEEAMVDAGTVNAENLNDAIFHITGTPTLKVHSVNKDANTPAFFSSNNGGLVPALANGWTQYSANDPFHVDLMGGRVHMHGLLSPGTTTIFATLPAWARPRMARRFIVPYRSSSTLGAIEVVIGADGNCAISEAAAGTPSVTDWLSLAGINWDRDQ